MEKISLILFDLSEVIIKGLKGTEKLVSRELNITEEEAIQGLGINHTKPKLLTKLFLAQITEQEYLHSVISNTNWLITENRLKQLIRKNMTEIPQMLTFATEISYQYNIALLSNHAKEWFEYCARKYKLNNIFNGNLFPSYSIKKIKPHKQAFEHILKYFEVPPNHCLLIDDSPVNIKSAKKINMKTILYQNSFHLIKKLEKDYDINLSAILPK